MSELPSQPADQQPDEARATVERQVQALAEQYLDQLQAGATPDRQALLRAHPDLAERLEPRLALVELMCRLGRAGASDSGIPTPPAPVLDGNGAKTSQPPRPAERTLRIKCPHCGNRIQLVEPEPHEVTCHNCGSSFHVDARATAPYRPEELPEKIGKFEVLEQLGRGAFGAVYKARDPELERTVALKVPRAGYFGTPEDQERFLREARSTAQLSHPGIVPVHEIGHERGLPYIVSDYIEGLTLADLLTGDRPAFRQSAELVARIADAVDHAHRQKVIHRDLKPSNVLIDAAGQPHVTDFGLARRDEGEMTVTLDGQILGTPAYMSPEQAAGDVQQVDLRSDIYSLGVVLYELLTGELPFRGNKRMLLHQVLHDEPRPPRRLNDRIPADLETICLKAMAKEPRRRYGTAADLATDLRRFLAGQPILARPVGRAERLWRWGRRNPVVSSLLAAVAALLIAVSVVSTISAFRIAGARDEARQNADDAQRHAESEGVARTAAEHNAEENRRLLGQQCVNEGVRFMDEGDLAGSLFWFAEALKRDPANADRAAMYRVRLAAVMQRCPRLVHLWILEGKVNHVEFSRDGRRLLTSSDDKTARVWDTATGEPLTPPLEHDPYPNAIDPSFSPRGKYVLTVSRRLVAENRWVHEGRVWAADTGKQVGPAWKTNEGMDQASFSPGGHHLYISRATFSPDDRHLLLLSDAGARVWEVATGRPITPLLQHPTGVTAAWFSPDGHRVLTLGQRSWIQGERSAWLSGYAARDVAALANPAQAGSIPALGSAVVVLWVWNLKPDARVWDVATGQPVTPSLTHGAGITEAQSSPDGRRVLTVGGTTARVWDAATGRALTTLKHDDEPEGELSEATFSPDGRRILALCAKDNTARVWDAVSGQQVITPLRHLYIHAASFSPDGSRVLTHSQPENWNYISQDFAEARVWDVQTGLPISPPLRTEGASFSPEGLRLLTIGKNGARICHAATGKPLAAILKPGRRPLFSPEGRYVVTTDGERTVQLWDVATRPPLTRPVRHEGTINLAVLSADGRRLATGTWNDRPRVWDTATGQALLPPLQADGLFRLAFSPDGRSLLALSGDFDKERGAAQVWEVATGRLLLPPVEHGRGVHHASFSPDSRLLATAAHEDPTAWVWDLATGRAVTSVRKQEGWIGGVWFSPDDRRLLTVMGALPGGEAQVWDVATGKPLTPPLRHEHGLLLGAFSPDGRLVLTVGDSGPTYEVRLWDGTTGRLLTSLKHDGWIREAIFSPDSRLVLVVGDRVRVYDVATGQPLTPHLGDELRMQKASFSPDSSRVLTASGDRDSAGEARVWDARSGQPLTPPLRHAFGVEMASFSADGRYVLTLCAGSAQVWEAVTGLPVTPPLLSGTQVSWAAFTPDSRRVLTASASTVRTWDLSPDPRAVEDLVRLAQVLSRHRMSDSGTIISLEANELQKEWQVLRSKYPEEFRHDSPDMPSWHRQEVEDALSSRPQSFGLSQGVYTFDDRPESSAAIFHLDPLIAAEPASVPLLLQRAGLHARLGHWEQAADDYDKATDQGAKGWEAWHQRGLVHAQLGQWDKASESFARATTFPDAPSEVWTHHALLRLYLGDSKGYRAACARLAERFGDNDPFAVTQTCALAPDAVTDLNRVVQLAEKVRASTGNSSILATLGGVLYRAGRFKEAAAKLTESAEMVPSQGDRERAWLYQALVEHRLGRRNEAKQALDRAVQGFEKISKAKAKEAAEDNRDFWAQRLEFQILKREAESLLQAPKP
jgi:WD40 repeat protein/tetratricopeptide (TPR) repeat protein